MNNSIRLRCFGGCEKIVRFTKSFVKRSPNRAFCRPCYKKAFKVSRPIANIESPITKVTKTKAAPIKVERTKKKKKN